MAGGKGRKPKPTALKQLAGNPGKRALNKDEPQFETLSHVDAPEHLSEFEYALECWETYCSVLCGSGVLTVGDLWNLEAFCIAYSTYRLSMEEARGQITVNKIDKKENYFPDKESNENKIDGIVAAIMGIGRAMYEPENIGGDINIRII